jgi:membrane-bound lytic murein transglycosylase F
MEQPEEVEKFVRPEIEFDLPEIMQKGKLTVLAENSTTSYFMYKGKQMGFEYELLKLFAEDIGVELEIKVVHNLDSLITMLNSGQGDLIACNYTVTRERNKLIHFSEPFMQSEQVLVQRKPTGWEDMDEEEWMAEIITDPVQLANKTVKVWQNSSYYERLMHLQEEIGDSINIEGLEGNVGGEELIEMVADGIIDYTITEHNVAQVNEQFFDNLYTDLTLSVKQKLAFGMRKSSHLLKVKLDEWLIDFKERSTYKYIARKYFELPHVAHKRQRDFSSLNGTSISAYDAFFKQAAAKSGWDWRLIAAISYQESKFNPNALSFGGAYGMMQFMPNTGPTYGVFPDSPPEVQIMGGGRKLAADEKHWKEIPDDFQRKKFSMASYNAGRGHIMDAQRLAKKHGLNHLVWDDNVEKMILNLSKQEYYQDEVVRHGMMRSRTTYNYVREVTERYHKWAAIYP